MPSLLLPPHPSSSPYNFHLTCRATQVADAEQAYIQAGLRGPETWVVPPVEHWPAWWHEAGFKRPVVRLYVALYGHPDAGTFWEEKCDTHCKAVGFQPIPDWPSCCCYPKLKLFLVIVGTRR